jgi:hypothetical protein
MVMMSSQFVRLLDDKLQDVFKNKNKEYDSGMKKKLYKVEKTDKAFAEYYGISGTQDIIPFNGALTELNVYPDWYTRVEPKEFGAKMVFQRKLIDDERYGVFRDRAGFLGEAVARTVDKYAARPIANAFSAAFDFMMSEEGVALCSSAHLTRSPGVSLASGFSNLGTSAVSKTAIAAARIQMKRFRNGDGQLVNVEPNAIICPTYLRDTVAEAIGYDSRTGNASELDPDSANHKINFSQKYEIIENTRLDDFSSKNWYLVDTRAMKKWLLWLDRIMPEYESRADFQTKNFEISTYFRFANAWLDWRWIYGNSVT